MRCGIDSVEISRIEKLIADHDREGLLRFFSADELDYADTGQNKAEKLAARFAAKEACAKLFPRETALGHIEPVDFHVIRGGHGDPQVGTSERAEAVLNQHQIKEIGLSITHTDKSATAIAVAQPQPIESPWYGKLAYRIIKKRQHVVLENLNRVFGKSLAPDQIRAIAEGFYAHFIRFFVEAFLFNFKTQAQKEKYVRIEGNDNLMAALEKGKGALLLTGHFGNWEVATVGAIGNHSDYFGRFHFIRRPVKPPFINKLVVRRFEKNGFGVIEKIDSVDRIVSLLEQNNIVVVPYDQGGGKKFGIEAEFFGHKALSFKSLSILARTTGAPVLPTSCWREKDGTHALGFDKEIELLDEGPTRKIVAENTKRFNQALERIILRHPEQWIWMHKRWKGVS